MHTPIPEQQEALDLLAIWLSQPPSAFVLRGFAGTGKTFTINCLLQKLPNLRPVFTAPTNKAVRVLKEFGASPAQTIHSLFGLVVKHKEGKEMLVQKSTPTISSYQLVIVDEASMVGEELFELMKSEFSQTHFLFVGDPAQLPPVGELSSPTLRLKNSFTLKTPMRQKEGGGLLNLCTAVRKRTRVRTPLLIKENSEVVVMEHRAWVRYVINSFELDGEFDKDPNNLRAIAYKNITVQKMNKAIQQFRYPNLETPFALGERVTCTSPVLFGMLVQKEGRSRRDVALPTETEGEIVECKQGEVLHEIPTWEVQINSYRNQIVIPDPQAVSKLEMQLQQVRKEKDWRTFFKLKESFASLRCAYAMTAHKSQGSTFDTVFIHAPDILSNFKKREAAQCLYVALTRARNKAVLNIPTLFS